MTATITAGNTPITASPTSRAIRAPNTRSCAPTPVTGKKALYVNKGFTRRILGVSRDESDGILHYLYDHMANPLFQCRYRWRENSIAFWDNRCVQHHAMWDYWPHTRSGHRVTVKGDRPV